MAFDGDNPWHSLVASIRRRRSPGARFFKPVCVIAAIDLADESGMDPENLDAHAIALKFRAYVGLRYPNRADEGWRPLWHLSNDGLWTFYSQGRVLTRGDFGPDGKPGSKSSLFPRFDRLALNGFLRGPWSQPATRKQLRSYMIEMLARDDVASRIFSRQLADPQVALDPDRWLGEDLSTIPEDEQLDIFHLGVGVEKDDSSAVDSGVIAIPFDPDAIDVITRSMTVDLLLSRVRNGMIDLQPDFQRRWGIWDNRRKSRLIESLLLRIPLPVLYMAENDDETWEVVDGIQRLSTVVQFISPDLINRPALQLTGLEYLREYEQAEFSGLNERLKMRLRETELVVHLIRRGTPAEVKFNIFARINSGGMALSPQELRHAVTPGPAREILAEWARSAEFLIATDSSVSEIRMDDRELVLRFLGFFVLGVGAYKHSDMDGFLIQAMKTVNEMSKADLERTRLAFKRSMRTAYALFDNEAFRKRVSVKKRHPINKALFEAVAVSLAQLSPEETQELILSKVPLLNDLNALFSNREFEIAISQGTGDHAKVQFRFTSIMEVFRRYVSADA